MNDNNLKQLGIAVLRTEAQAIQALAARIDEDFVTACNLLYQCRGRIVVSGMGKSGHIAGKIAATLASTGSPAFFVHPAEASHGDLGMVCQDDVLLMLSNSGETHELLTIAPIIRRRGIDMIALTGSSSSSLANLATVHIDTSVDREACPLGLAPTASTSAALAMGDALAIALLERRGFSADDFARSHPGGVLGRRLLVHVSDVMRGDEKMPCVHRHASLADSLLEMSLKGLGVVVVVDEKQRAIGVFTDGDLRRKLDEDLDMKNTPIEQVMTVAFKNMQADQLAADAVSIMQANKITSVLITDHDGMLVGVLHMHDLLNAGVL